MSFFCTVGEVVTQSSCVFVLPTPFRLGQSLVISGLAEMSVFLPRSEVMGKHESMQGGEEDGWELSGSHRLVSGCVSCVSTTLVVTNGMCGFLCNS